MVDLAYKQIRESESFPFAREIAKPFGVLDQIIPWCKSELRDEWRWQLVQPSSDIAPGRYVFYFDSDRDYCAFIMRWC